MSYPEDAAAIESVKMADRYCTMCEKHMGCAECPACGWETITVDELQDRAEAQLERWHEQYYGGDGPQTLAEQQEVARKVKYRSCL